PRNSSAGEERPEPSGTSIEKGHARANGDHVSGDIEGIRDDEDNEKYAKDRSTRPLETLDSQFAQTLASREGRSITYLLDRRHERKGDEGSPNEGQTELCSGLRVCCDSGGVVIGRPGHQSRPHGPQVLAPDRSLVLGGEIEFRSVPGRGSGYYALFSRIRFAPRLDRHSSAPVNLTFRVLRTLAKQSVILVFFKYRQISRIANFSEHKASLMLVHPDGKSSCRSASLELKFRNFGLIFPRRCSATNADVKTPLPSLLIVCQGTQKWVGSGSSWTMFSTVATD